MTAPRFPASAILRLLPALALATGAGCAKTAPGRSKLPDGFPPDSKTVTAGAYRMHHARLEDEDLLLVEKDGQPLHRVEGNKISSYVDGRALFDYVYNRNLKAVATFMVHIRNADGEISFTLLDENADGVWDQKIDYGTRSVYDWKNNQWTTRAEGSLTMSTPTLAEPSRPVPVLGTFDVVVCGGGPAGCAAAVAAARNGARTLLLEKEGFLGGSPCTQLVCVILSTNGADFQGIWHEYVAALRRRDGIRPFAGSGQSGQIRSAVDPEQVKFAWDELVSGAGVELLHHAWGARGIVEGGRARGVYVETRAGRRAILAERVIDATGDGTVAAESGVAFEQGDGRHPWAMALTKVFRMGNVVRPAIPLDKAVLEAVERDLDAAIARGDYTTPVLLEKTRFLNYLRGWHWALPEPRTELLSVLSRVLKADPLDPWDLTRAEREGREQARQAADAMRRFAPGFEEAYLLDTSASIGVRSSRRLKGLATVTDEDAWEFRRYADGVARSSWDVDVWPADSYSKPAVPRGEAHYAGRQEAMRNGAWFDIRYGCLVAAGVDNLLMAGRCISASHIAESSLRIQQTCMATGQAAGTAAALSLQAGVTPRELDPLSVVRQLEKDRAENEERGSRSEIHRP